MGWNHQPESNLLIQKDELFDFRQNWKINEFAPRRGGTWGIPTGQRVAGDAMDFGVTEIRV